VNTRPLPAVLALLLFLQLWYLQPARAEWYSDHQAIMGTRIAVELWTEDRAQADRLIAQVMAEMRRIDVLMSTYKPDSQVSRVNAEAAQRPVKVDADLFELLWTALEYSRLTEGAFDITYASVGHLYDFRRHVKPTPEEIARALPAVNYQHVILDRAKQTVRFARPGVRIDLGGIAKGWAVDQCIELLKRAGVARAMVTAGGDTRIIGDRFGRPWMVGIRDPDDRDRTVINIPLTDAAFSTSGDYERYFEENGIRYHHILEPGSGKPAGGTDADRVRSVTIIGATATRTDGLSKTIFVLGIERGMRVLDRLGDVDAIVINGRGEKFYSRGLAPPPQK
jgi:thiamine biosynthesis lipoprotein